MNKEEYLKLIGKKDWEKKDYKLGDMIMKDGNPFGIYAKEIEGENLGIYLSEAKSFWRLDLKTKKLYEIEE